MNMICYNNRGQRVHRTFIPLPLQSIKETERMSKILSYCRIDGCLKINSAKGLCKPHYEQQRLYGDPLIKLKDHGVGNTREEKFWSKVKRTNNPDECWEWQGIKNSRGYGVSAILTVTPIIRSAHRKAFYYAYGIVPTAFICHTCDNPPCCNPKHLYEGSYQDNANDRVRRGRQLRGSLHGRAKVTDAEVLEMRRLANGHTIASLARQFHLSESATRSIIKGENWKHI